MNLIKAVILIACCGLVYVCHAAGAEMSDQDIHSTFVQANEAFRKADTLTDDADAAGKLYSQAILGYEKIINQGGVLNSKLFYNLANACLLKGDVGNAILNYRNAQVLDESDADIGKNLAFARSRRLDEIEATTEKKVFERLFFWHYDFSMKSRFLAACIGFAVVCLILTIRIWRPAAPGTVAACIVVAIFTVCLAVSVGIGQHVRTKDRCGVILADSVEARQGDGPGYPLSFKGPLHAGTEFDLLEQRPGWWHVRLANGTDAWIPDTAAQQVISGR
ncbi:MAG: hypothetical protein J7M40_15135 [Planctomycetes bacterium]|nr:hypothetical protein [Planctomycetota bacterium]